MSDTNQSNPQEPTQDQERQPQQELQPPQDAGFSASLQAFEERQEAPKPRRRSRRAKPAAKVKSKPGTKVASKADTKVAPEADTKVAPEPDTEVVPEPDTVPEIPMGPAPEPFEEDYATQAARLADQDFDELLEDLAPSPAPAGAAPVAKPLEGQRALQAGEAGSEATGDERGKRRRGRRRRGRGRRGKGDAGAPSGQPELPADTAEAPLEPVEAGELPEPAAPMTTTRTDLAEPVVDDMADVEPTAEPVDAEAEQDQAGIGVEQPVEGQPAGPGEQARRRRRRGRGRRRRGQDKAGEPVVTGEAVVAAPQAPVRALPVPEAEAVEAEYIEEEEGEAIPGKIMLVNIAQRDECRIAMLEEDLLQEFYVERTAALSHVGNIYKGVVTNIEPSIQAAFIDFGEGKNGFLHISDLQPQYFPGGGEAEDVGRKTPRKERPPIQKCLRRNQEVIVQVTKEGIGTKGATLTTYCALPGRYLVMMPGMSRLGVSRKIEDEDARRRMRDVLNQLELPGDMGFILRTAGLDRNKRELQRDLNYLVRLWRQIIKRKNSIKAPAELYQESDLVTRTLRDVVTTDVQEVLIDSEPVANSARQFLHLLSPRLAERVRFYQGSEPLFFKYGVEDEIAKIYSKRVPLASGGSLVIESTEALVAIDVNSGKFREAPDPEESAFRINLEAAEEIARQLSLRDLGGVIICDFIDMHMERHRREIERALREALKKHKERAEILRMSRFGIIEMTRQRQRPSIIRSMLIDCPHCTGTGMIKSVETVMLEALRALQTAATHPDVARVEVRVDPQVAQMLLNNKRQILAEIEARNGKSIVVLPGTDVAANKITLICYDHRGWPVQVQLPRSMMGAAGAR